MTRQLIIRTEVDAEIQGIRSSLEMARSGIGERFVEELASVLQRIESHPFLYAILDLDIRAVHIPKSAYVLYYFVTDNRIEVFAVTLGARDKPVWLDRR